ncbi:hypothetical protein QOZ80_8BG0642870 [Eleusine coracana subsp. coracana]|nr:hypothetical protein QOZ80_8BG0642870 [Eleusine coracana subsp. coracana]
MATLVALASQSQLRRPRPYTPSPWGDFFLNHQTCTPSELLSMKKEAHAKKEKVRRTVMDAIGSNSKDLIRKLELIDTLQQIGVGYHYKEEINEFLHCVYDDKDGGSDDLYVTSLRFYLLRKHGYAVPSDVFLKFKDEQGNVSTLYCEELKELTIWWMDFKSRVDLTFARDRMVELHFWMLGVVYEPQCSFSRIMMTKLVVLTSLFDDLYDNYSTTDESNIFTEAIERWDEQATEQLPTNLKEIFINILNTTNKVEKDLELQKNKQAKIFRKMVISTAKFYHAEVKWRDEHYVPTTVEEHLQISLRSAACMPLICLAFTSLSEDVASREEAITWALTFPKIIRGVSIVGRIGNDIMSHEREQALEHVASTVQTCMKQYGVTVEEANEKLRTIIEESWMDIVEECLDGKRPMEVLEKPVNTARTMDFMYKREDAYTLSFSLKDVITSMYVNPV